VKSWRVLAGVTLVAILGGWALSLFAPVLLFAIFGLVVAGAKKRGAPGVLARIRWWQWLLCFLTASALSAVAGVLALLRGPGV
jgi:hypothetical protein